MNVTEEDFAENRRESRKIHIPRETQTLAVKFILLVAALVAIRILTIHFF